ncbi:MAG: phospho-sugar mutase, partial [Oscillospiraceae bacterium]|nr:phospho-sugar mutase [Oscillospiraceae bacterium]
MNYKAEYEKWLDSPSLSEREWKELHDIRNDEKEIENRFFAPLDFGTAGLRGTMKVGLHQMNIHIIRHATQAFANVILSEGEEAMAKGVIVCYDCRINSEVFAREAACVMAANGIRVRIFDALRPTPELSFAIRYYGAAAGINVTASHNPKEYNGYKVYWSDGAQLPPKQAAEIAQQMSEIDIFTGFKSMDFEEGVATGAIEMLGKETDEAFLARVLGQAIDKEVVKRVADNFHVVYTPFHGTGYKLVPEALKRLGIKHINCVEKQMVIDGAFPTVESPNPENPEGFYLAVDLAKEVNSDIIIGTDPDADRIGVMVRQSGTDEYIGITGNQLGVLLLDYVINAKRRTGTMPANPAALKTIVTTEMAREVCEQNGVYTVDTFTGFKFMAEKIA